MAGRTYSISDEVYRSFPRYVRGVVVAYDLHNGASSPELVAELRQAEVSLRERLSPETLTSEPAIAAWRDAFKAEGIKPNDFRCSIEAMARRVVRGQSLPSINTLVDIGNILSLRHLVPVGSHAIDEVKTDLHLRRATGAEVFVPFGSDVPEHPAPGEIVFTEGDVVVTRRWSWRQANHTLTLPTTTAIVLNVDGLPPITSPQIEAICREAMVMIQRHCGGVLRRELFSPERPSLSIER